jgi:hypothetical protein
MMTRFIGIDPGQHGGLAVVEGEAVIHTEPLPLLGKQLNVSALMEILATWNPAGVCIEQQAGRFSTPNTYYQALGAIEACAYYGFTKARLITPAPAKWHSVLLGKVPKGKTKEYAELRCRRLFPEFCAGKAKLHDGIVDAILLAQYGIQTIQAHSQSIRD